MPGSASGAPSWRPNSHTGGREMLGTLFQIAMVLLALPLMAALAAFLFGGTLFVAHSILAALAKWLLYMGDTPRRWRAQWATLSTRQRDGATFMVLVYAVGGCVMAYGFATNFGK